MIEKLQDDSAESKSVRGLIFDVDSTMTAEQNYETPEIMSEATTSQSETLKAYAYNQVKNPEVSYYVS